MANLSSTNVSLLCKKKIFPQFFTLLSYFSLSFSLSLNLDSFHVDLLPYLKGRKARGAQPVNYRSFNERNCTPLRHPRRFLLSILTWRIDTAYLALPRGSAWRLHRENSHRNFADGIVPERVTRFRDRIVSRASGVGLGRDAESLFLINNRREFRCARQISSALLTNTAAASRFLAARR